MGAALRHLNVEIEVVSLPDDLRRSVEEAQRRQAKGNVRAGVQTETTCLAGSLQTTRTL